MRLYADVMVVGYQSLTFDMLFSILRLSPLYLRDDFWMNAIACIFSVATPLAFSMSIESSVSHVLDGPFIILSSETIAPPYNKILNYFCFATHM